jgi:hypothetical protein
MLSIDDYESGSSCDTSVSSKGQGVEHRRPPRASSFREPQQDDGKDQIRSRLCGGRGLAASTCNVKVVDDAHAWPQKPAEQKVRCAINDGTEGSSPPLTLQCSLYTLVCLPKSAEPDYSYQ